MCPTQRKSCEALMWDSRAGLALRGLREGLGIRGMNSSLGRCLTTYPGDLGCSSQALSELQFPNII